MNLETSLYILAVSFAVFFSFLAIKTRAILNSIIFLVGMYAASAWALIQLGAWFLALVYLFINAGGVLVLIIFASMLTRPAIDIPPSRIISLNALFISFLLTFLIFYFIFSSNIDFNTIFSSNYLEISKLLFSDYALAIILLAVGALAVYLGAMYVAGEEK